MKIFTKLILLISLGVIMTCVQSGINSIVSHRINASNEAIHYLNMANGDLSNAIIEEKIFLKTHKEEHSTRVMNYIKHVNTSMNLVENDSIGVDYQDEVSRFKQLLNEYKNIFSKVSQNTKGLDSINNALNNEVYRYNQQANSTIKKIREEIGFAMINVEEVDENIKSLSEVTKNIALWIERVMLIVNQDLFLYDDKEMYSHHIKEAFGELQKEKGNANTIRKFLKDPAYVKSTEQMSKIIDKLPTQTDQIYKLWDENGRLEAKLDYTRGQLLEISKKISSSAKTDATHFEKRMQGINILAFIIIVIAFILGGILIYRSLSKTLNYASEELTQAADQVASASTQLSLSSQQIAEGTSEQASSLEETSSSLEELTSMTKQNADNAQQADILTNEAGSIVNEVREKLEQMTVAINDIDRNSGETQKIIKVIDEIAFQTNLLALNAAVEAARAGEHGAGFAVVAEEVRNLAQRSAEAAKSTNDLIGNTISSVKAGAGLNEESNKAFKKNAEITGKINTLVDEIATASNEQAQGIDQINNAVTNMDKATQSNAANAEENAATSEEMQAQAETLKNIIGDLATLIGGSSKKVESKKDKIAKGQKGTGKE
ncbi:MAG: methyl-accepting chemotaxis protein [Thermodesulfobacteriota bacterium]|nr:methyl-accepting chemotaxis protein [Thermodesulfobacteriota bacterium]